MVVIAFEDPATARGSLELISEDNFPEAGTPEGRAAIEAAIAELNPNPAWIGVAVVTEHTVTVGEKTFNYRQYRQYASLEDYFDSL